MTTQASSPKGNSRFTDDEVLAMRRAARARNDRRTFIKTLAEETGANIVTVRHLLMGKNYAHVSEALTAEELGLDPKHGRPVLTDDQVLDARRRYAAGRGKLTLVMLEEEFGLGPNRLRKMLLGQSYAHVAEAVPRMLELRLRRKWTDEQVIEMRGLYPQDGMTLAILAARYGGDETSISAALLGHSYCDVPGPIERLKPAGMKHAESRNLQARSLTPEVALFMRLQYRPKRITMEVIAKGYGVKRDVVRQALLGITYKEVPDPLPHLGEKRNKPPAKLDLDDAQVIALRSEFRTGRRSGQSIAKELGVDTDVAMRMLRGKTFKHVAAPVLETMATIRKRRRAHAAATKRDRERKIKLGIPLRPLIRFVPRAA